MLKAGIIDFFKSCLAMAGCECDGSIYKYMDAALESDDEDSLTVSTKLSGTRSDPTLRGSITNLGIDNFTPVALMNGFLGGMVSEIIEMIEPTGFKATSLVGSGNGLRKNVPLQKRFSAALGARMQIPLNREEAAFGAVLTALVAAKAKESLEQAQKLISYEI